jgi:hypothetical protein
MEQIFAKRVISLTKALLLIFCFSSLSFIHKLDSTDKQQDYYAVIDILNLNERIHGLIEDDDRTSDRAYRWLEVNNNKIWEDNSKVRSDIIDRLKICVEESSILRSKVMKTQHLILLR